MTALTGETGAGKSIIIDALGTLLFARSPRGMIRTGADKAAVSALFSDLSPSECAALEELGCPPDENGELYMCRTITADGRSTAKINNKTVPLSMMREAGAHLVDIHGQNDSAALLSKQNHLTILDEYAGVDASSSEYAGIYKKLCETREQFASLTEAAREKNMLVDILKYKIAEIDAAKLSAPDEEERLEALKAKLKNRERISKNASLVYRALASSERGATASYLIERACMALAQLSDVIPEAEEYSKQLESYRLEIVDIAERVSQCAEDDGEDPEKKLDAIESRLNQISKLRAKYGATIEEIKAYRADAARRLSDLEESDIKISELTALTARLEEEAAESAAVLTEKRKAAAEKLAAEVMDALAFLDMPKVRFAVDMRRLTEQNGGARYSPRGVDDVEFMIATNPGEPLGPMAKIASGGELSRIMLALKSSLNAVSGAQTLIFDEIDTGVSGSTARKVGIKMKRLSRCAQVLCVTHSAQIASLADTHLLVEKHEVGGRSETSVRELDGAGREAEIARIIGGISVTDSQRAAAREMIAEGGNIK